MKFKKGEVVKFFGTSVTAIVVGFNFSEGIKTYNLKTLQTQEDKKFVQEHELEKVQ